MGFKPVCGSMQSPSALQPLFLQTAARTRSPFFCPRQRSSSFPHGRSHVTGFQELKSCQALLSKLNIFCNFTCIFADISPTAVSRNYYSKWENYCQKLKKFHPKSIVPKLQNSPMGDFAVQNAAVIFFRQS